MFCHSNRKVASRNSFLCLIGWDTPFHLGQSRPSLCLRILSLVKDWWFGRGVCSLCSPPSCLCMCRTHFGYMDVFNDSVWENWNFLYQSKNFKHVPTCLSSCSFCSTVKLDVTMIYFPNLRSDIVKHLRLSDTGQLHQLRHSSRKHKN